MTLLKNVIVEGRILNIESFTVADYREDVLLGVHRGIDIKVQFTYTHKGKTLVNERIIHISGVDGPAWTFDKVEQKAWEEVTRYNSIIEDVHYPKKWEA